MKKNTMLLALLAMMVTAMDTPADVTPQSTGRAATATASTSRAVAPVLAANASGRTATTVLGVNAPGRTATPATTATAPRNGIITAAGGGGGGGGALSPLQILNNYANQYGVANNRKEGFDLSTLQSYWLSASKAKPAGTTVLFSNALGYYIDEIENGR